MHIAAFTIDGFGIFSDVTVDRLSPGMCIFLGQNEAGKSTCLEFLRTMLTGYPDPRSREARRCLAPLRGGQAGGSLELATEMHDTVRLTRRPGSGGGILTLSDADGGMLAPELMQQLLYGITREVYRNVFGFSLHELESFDSLSAEGVRNALYGASFGPGLRTPGDALRALERQEEDIFKNGGTRPPLNQAMRQLEELRTRIGDLATQCAGFDRLALELGEKKSALAELRRKRNSLEEERRLLERRLGVWRQWDEWRLAGVRLERLADISETFPEDGAARLARLQEARETGERRLAAHAEKLARLRERHDAIPMDRPLLEALGLLRRLAERKSSYRQALSQLPVQEEFCRRSAEELRNGLLQLGSGWTCQRIHDTDRSLFTREDLERQAREMAAAASAHQAAVDGLARANRDVDSAERAIAAATEAMTLLPEPVAALSDDARDELRRLVARIEDGQRQLPARQRALYAARTAFARAYDPLRLGQPFSVQPDDAQDDPPAETGARQALDTLLSRQDAALTLAAEVQGCLAQATERAHALQQAEEAVEAVKKRMDVLRKLQRVSAGPSREALDNRSASLRSLRALSASIHTERERLEDLDSRISAEHAPLPVKSVPLIVVGALLMAGGCGILLAHWLLGMTSFPVTASLSLPTTLWSGYLVLACGVGFLAGGVPRSSPEAKRHQREMAQLQSRRETCALHLAELGEQARQLCVAAGVESMDPVTLEATEMLLEREKEQCFHEERSRQDMDMLMEELSLARAQLRTQQTTMHEMEGIVQKTRRRWHELMQALQVGSVPSPESAAAFFAKAEAASVALEAVSAADGELHALREELRELHGRIAAVPAIAQRVEQPCDPGRILACVDEVLDACKDADAAREQRIKAEATRQHHENELERCLAGQAEASARFHEADQRLAQAREAWSCCLRELDLDEGLDPETVREAFKIMENCLAAEAAGERAHTELAQGQEELAALREPLCELLAGLGRSPDTDADGEADWLASLDTVLAAAEAMERNEAERERLAARITEQEDEIRAEQAALDTARQGEADLLTLAGAKDSEDFLRLAGLRHEQQELQRRREDLESALSLAADAIPLADFLASFQEEEQESQEKRCRDIQTALGELADAEQEHATAVAQLSARVTELSRADELARLRQEEAMLLESMRRMALAWSRRALARQILLHAKQTFEKERQPEVIRMASDIFARITSQRWRGINASLEEASLRILPATGEPVGPEALSRGTQEQVYLALRLAYIKNHAAHAAPLPVIMDDVLVNFDAQRAERTARAFADLAEGRNGARHQLFYFTCHPHMADMLRAAAPGAALFHVENGHISQA